MFLRKPLHLLNIYWIVVGFIGTSQLFHMFLRRPMNEIHCIHLKTLVLLVLLEQYKHLLVFYWIYWDVSAICFTFEEIVGFTKHLFDFCLIYWDVSAISYVFEETFAFSNIYWILVRFIRTS